MQFTDPRQRDAVEARMLMITVVARIRYRQRDVVVVVGGTRRVLALVEVVMRVAMGQRFARPRKSGKAGEKKTKDAKAH